MQNRYGGEARGARVIATDATVLSPRGQELFDLRGIHPETGQPLMWSAHTFAVRAAAQDFIDTHQAASVPGADALERAINKEEAMELQTRRFGWRLGEWARQYDGISRMPEVQGRYEINTPGSVIGDDTIQEGHLTIDPGAIYVAGISRAGHEVSRFLRVFPKESGFGIALSYSEPPTHAEMAEENRLYGPQALPRRVRALSNPGFNILHVVPDYNQPLRLDLHERLDPRVVDILRRTLGPVRSLLHSNGRRLDDLIKNS